MTTTNILSQNTRKYGGIVDLRRPTQNRYHRKCKYLFVDFICVGWNDGNGYVYKYIIILVIRMNRSASECCRFIYLWTVRHGCGWRGHSRCACIMQMFIHDLD